MDNVDTSPADLHQASAPPRKRCLVVRPVQPEAAHGGDEIIYRRSIEFLSRTMDVEICQLQSVGRARQFIELFKGTPPETTRFLGEENRQRVSAAIASYKPDVACFFNEVTFPSFASAKAAGIKTVLVAQNVHSIVAATDPAGWTKIFEPLAAMYERKWYGDEAAELVCISKVDVDGLAKAGVRRKKIWVAPPGCPPAAPLADHAGLLPELVLTGSYAWWRKRRDLKKFAKGDPLAAKMYVFDSAARDILGDQAQDPGKIEIDWSSGVRFGLVTDRFLGGFKLKALEYVAKNCIILTASDISTEFEGLPHAEIFVRVIANKDDVRRIIQEFDGISDVVGKFRAFKEACLLQYGWERCLAPLGEAVNAALTTAKV
jgi:hypothetical protein